MFCFHFLQFCKIIFENLHLINDHFKTIFGHFSAKYIYVFDKNEDLMIILRCLVCLIRNWIKSYDKLLVEIFFSCLKMHYFRVSLREKVLTPQNKISSHKISKWLIQRRNIPHFKAFGISNYKHEVRICHKICIKGTMIQNIYYSFRWFRLYFWNPT